MSRKPIEDYYDSIASKYDQIWPASEYRIPAWLINFFTNFENAHPRILDLGCGSGIVGDILKDLKIKPNCLFGLDLSEQMVSEAIKKGLYTGVEKCDLQSGLPDKKSNIYDVVTACGLMEFIPDKELLLRDIFNQLDNGGTLLATFEASKDAIPDVEAVETSMGTITKFRISEEDLISLVEKIGFNVINLIKDIGYKSPSSGKIVDYFLLEAKKP